MHPRILSFVVAAIAYGVTLTVAAVVLPGMRIGFLWGLIAWALFTVSITLLRPVLARTLSGHVRSATWAIGLATVFLSLWVTVIFSPSSGFSIRGFWTWIWATLIVWLGTLVYDAVDDRLVAAARPMADRVQSEIDERTRRTGSSADRAPYTPPTTPGTPPTDPGNQQPGRPPEHGYGPR